MYDLTEFIFASFLIACISVVYHCVLRRYLLSGWFFWGYKKYGMDENNWKYYIYMPIWGCEQCIAGQIALWTFAFMFEYHFAYHIGYIALTILLSKILTFIYIKTDYDN